LVVKENKRNLDKGREQRAKEYRGVHKLTQKSLLSFTKIEQCIKPDYFTVKIKSIKGKPNEDLASEEIIKMARWKSRMM